MKKILTLIAVFAILTGYSQECSITALGLSYLVPKGVNVEVIKSGKFQMGIGLSYNRLTTSELKEYEGIKSSLDIVSYAGYRVYHKEYRTAVYTNIGFAMGNVYSLRSYYSARLMFLRDQVAYSIEPYWLTKPGLKLTFYRRI